MSSWTKQDFYSCLCVLPSCSFFFASLSDSVCKSILLLESKCWSPNCEASRTACSVFESYPYMMNTISIFSAGEKKIFLVCVWNKLYKYLKKRKGIILRCTKKPQIFPIEGNSWHLRNTHWHCLAVIVTVLCCFFSRLPAMIRPRDFETLRHHHPESQLQCFSDIPELLNKLSFMCSSDKELAYFWYQPDTIFSIIHSLQCWCCDVCSTELSEHWMSQPQCSCRQNLGKIPSLKGQK